ncbi:hypothetical protein COCSUDRAFT_58627 [Coccomyxa subellipsoidea C-169]|uniref:Glycoside hydrolase n=1 Tax=Coccomyxa subellipsoidea (strain C-169) TaxID=574566 RepID=I0YLR4_COCSC|nr:hypothetical protein COCSUDRAFT_58627 [Coccomyxa subellipsoidea C-169]EIE19333.1 hypothetical protein COCSUDRAFT_58627 [Coccomyxa subellipsoidea C-169]|eukprot:XP_005643877.1 hypothetical protein COCSUDRAFT_58627 [Coccomyxa subellipsoidea C-169]
MARHAYIQAAAVLLVSCTLVYGRPSPAPAPSSTDFAPVPAPAPAPPENCDCNPSIKALTGECKPFRLASKFACDVDPYKPHQMYPRPQMLRGNDTWINLNGIWEWEANVGWEDGAPPINRTLARKIVVPFGVRADLSGVEDPYRVGVTHMWYRRSFRLPGSWRNLRNASRTVLHFGAVDWQAQVWVNGVEFPQHNGGYDKFAVDITDALKHGNSGQHELIVRVYDPTDSAHIPLGKQRKNNGGIFYMGTEGIWQTVWLERVSEAYISRLDMIPDVDAEHLSITVQGNKQALGLPVRVAAIEDGKKVSFGEGVVGRPFNLSLPNPRLWSPAIFGGEPFLYDIEVSLYPAATNSTAAKSTADALDTVKGYFGMRKAHIAPLPNNGPMFIWLNNKPITQVGLLDQGYWPDGLYTAPTEEALCWDIQEALRLGFTTLRKHIKVEPDRWYYCADKLGMLVWQDMPAMFWEDPFNDGVYYRHPQEKAQHTYELTRMIEEHLSFPSIIQYYTFNEGWGQYDTQKAVQAARSEDPSRLWGATSGWEDPQDITADKGAKYQHYTGYVGEIRDDHMYPGPYSSGATETRASVNGEYGGLALYYDGHSDLVKASTGLSAAIYTQLTDVEAEVNGILTYDRKVLKLGDANLVRDEIKKVVNSLST